MGADEAIVETPVDRFAASRARQQQRVARHSPGESHGPLAEAGDLAGGRASRGGASRDANANATPDRAAAPSHASAPNRAPAPSPRPTAVAGDAAAAAVEAERLAGAAGTLEALRQALDRFDGCALKRGARQTVFADGAPGAPVMIVGEAPGAEEDRQGRPFVGDAGRLLDRMLAAIGASRSDNVYITNVVNWRPPANRTPSLEEIAICRPFILRHIALAAPRVVVVMGNTAAKGVLQASAGITALRGRWQTLAPTESAAGAGDDVGGAAGAGQSAGRGVAVMPTFHPAYLLRQPALKGLAWQDLLQIAERIKGA
ncbi:hypothetical protein CCR85_12660 [Rhodothalassium salexigens]|nr:uracil-DNA glycosylase [Rhodothalassium salexigens]MBK5912337.1 hypothetical protein [Rhodothalassium salexigens]MBK5920013.1 hypothetical protein [Rhodothalassium salexigens]